jgi:hypothetical protein
MSVQMATVDVMGSDSDADSDGDARIGRRGRTQRQRSYGERAERRLGPKFHGILAS